MIDGTRQHLVARPFVLGQTFAGQRADIDRGTAGDDYAIHRHLRARLDHDALADLDVAGQNARLLAILQTPAAIGEDLHNAGEGMFGACERYRLQTLAEHADEDDLGRHQRFPNINGRHAGDAQGQVGANPALEKALHGSIDDACPTQYRRDQRETKDADPGGPTCEGGNAQPISDARQQVQADQGTDHARHEIERQVAVLAKRGVSVRDFAMHRGR